MTVATETLLLLMQPFDEAGMPAHYFTDGSEWQEATQPVKIWDGAAWVDST